MLNVTWSGIKM